MTPEDDPRPFADVLRDWSTRLNGGSAYGARKLAARELRESESNIQHWLKGRRCTYERPLRRLMTLLERPL